jgi:FkbM family methyltransferase
MNDNEKKVSSKNIIEYLFNNKDYDDTKNLNHNLKINNPENINFPDISTTLDVYFCFRLLLGRNPSKEEWKGHSSLAGSDIRSLVKMYLTSAEFKKREIFNDTDDLQKVMIDNFEMFVSLSDLTVGKPLYTNKIYEPEVTKVLKSQLKKGMCFIDVGANIGYFSMLAASYTGPEGSVYSFEPFENNIKLLYLNANLNKFKIKIYPFALADEEKLWFYGHSGSNGNIFEISDNAISILSNKVVYSTKLDNYINEFQKVDIIKIDIEGAEYLAVNGAKNLIKKYHPIIISEFSPPALNSISHVTGKEYLNFFIEQGYTISIINKDGNLLNTNNDVDFIMKYFHEQLTDHIDIYVN